MNAPVIVPAETLQIETEEPRARLHPLVTSLWVAAAILVGAHVLWVYQGLPGREMLAGILGIG